MPKDEFVSINGLEVDERKVRGVIGPGTGLGNAVLYTAEFK